jgi:hypothetical protein
MVERAMALWSALEEETDGFEMLDDGKRPEVHVTGDLFNACKLQYLSVPFTFHTIILSFHRTIWGSIDFNLRN